jgi:hypothetical protein
VRVYQPVIAELENEPKLAAEDAIRRAREARRVASQFPGEIARA